MRPNPDTATLFDNYIRYRVGLMPVGAQDNITPELIQEQPVVFLTPVGIDTGHGFVGRDEFSKIEGLLLPPTRPQSVFSFVNNYGGHWSLVEHSHTAAGGWVEKIIDCKGDGACGVHAMVNAILNNPSLKQREVIINAARKAGLSLADQSSQSIPVAIDFIINILSSGDQNDEENRRTVAKLTRLKATNGAYAHWVDGRDIEVFSEALGIVSCTRNKLATRDQQDANIIEKRDFVIRNLKGEANGLTSRYGLEEQASILNFVDGDVQKEREMVEYAKRAATIGVPADVVDHVATEINVLLDNLNHTQKQKIQDFISNETGEDYGLKRAIILSYLDANIDSIPENLDDLDHLLNGLIDDTKKTESYSSYKKAKEDIAALLMPNLEKAKIVSHTAQCAGNILRLGGSSGKHTPKLAEQGEKTDKFCYKDEGKTYYLECNFRELEGGQEEALFGTFAGKCSAKQGEWDKILAERCNIIYETIVDNTDLTDEKKNALRYTIANFQRGISKFSDLDFLKEVMKRGATDALVMDKVEEKMNGHIFEVPGHNELHIQMLYAPQYNQEGAKTNKTLGVMLRGDAIENGPRIIKKRLASAREKIYKNSTVIVTNIGDNIYAPREGVGASPSYVKKLNEIFKENSEGLSKTHSVERPSGRNIKQIITAILEKRDYSKFLSPSAAYTKIQRADRDESPETTLNLVDGDKKKAREMVEYAKRAETIGVPADVVDHVHRKTFKLSREDVRKYIESLPQDTDGEIDKRASYFQYLLDADKKDEKYLRTVEDENDGLYLEVKEKEMHENARSLIVKFFGSEAGSEDSLAKDMIGKFNTQYRGIYNSQKGKEDTNEARLDRVLFLYDHIAFVQNLDREAKLLSLAERRLQEIKDSKDLSSANKFSTRSLFGDSEESLAGKVTISKDITSKEDAEILIENCKSNIAKYRAAFQEHVGNPSKINSVDGIDAEISERRDFFAQNAVDFLGTVQKAILHTTGISRESSPMKDPRWREFVDIRNKMMGGAENSPDLTSEHVDFRRNYLQSLFNSRLIGEEEFNTLSKELDNQKGKFTEENKRRLEALNKMTEDAGRSLLDKLEKDLDAKDELYQAKLLHFLILSSVVFPVPIFGLLFDFLEPFLGGDLNLSEFLTSFFSVDGPFGNLAWVFDKMELDKAVSYITGDILGGPFDVVNGLLQNGITTPIASSVGNGMAGSPLSGLILLGLAEATTRVVEKTANHNVAGKNILSDAVKSLEKGFLDQYHDTINKDELFEKTSLKSEFDIKKRIFLADDSAKWLKEQHDKYPKSCEAFIENTLGDKATPILKILNGADKDAILTNLVKHFYETEKEGKLFEKIAMLKKAEETPEGAKKVGEIFWSNFNYERLEKLKLEYPLLTKVEEGAKVKELKDCFEENRDLKDDLINNPSQFIKFVAADKTYYHSLSNILGPLEDIVDSEKAASLTDIFSSKIAVFCASLLSIGNPVSTGEAEPPMFCDIIKVRLEGLKQIILLEDKIAKQPSHIANALKDIKYDEVKQKLERDFGFHLAERHNLENPDKVIEHQYLPAKINGIFQEDLKDEAIAVLEALDPTFEKQQLNIFGKKIFDAAQNFNTEKGHQHRIAELQELLTGDILSEVADRVLLVKFMQRTEPAEYVKLLEESKGVDFNFDKFWQENLKGHNQETVLRYKKSLGKLQCLAIQHYMQEGKIDKDQAREKFIAKIFGGSLEELVYAGEHINKLSNLAGSIKQEYDAKAPTIDEKNFVKMQMKMMQESPSPITSPREVSQLKSGGIGR